MKESVSSIDLMEEPSEEYLRWRAEKRKRLRVVAAIVPAVLGATAAMLAVLMPSYESSTGLFPFYLNRSVLGFIAPVLLLMSGLAVLMIYLQTGFSKRANEPSESLRYESELRRLRNRIEHEDSTGKNELNKLKKDLEKFRSELDSNSSISAAITAKDKDELVSLLKSEIVDKSTDDASTEFLSKIKSQVEEVNKVREVEEVFSRTLERLYKETEALSWRGNLNLSLGILTTIVGLGILGYFVLEIDTVPEDKIAFIAHFIPRLSLVILIEIFAYFFLKLYKSSLSEIKYFQNEMTNIEAKLAALKCSLITSDSGATTNVIKVLSETERNAVME
ncbi:hypothetical protein ACFL2V_20860, partial [Pseudomonadota bacterium]